MKAASSCDDDASLILTSAMAACGGEKQVAARGTACAFTRRGTRHRAWAGKSIDWMLVARVCVIVQDGGWT